MSQDRATTTSRGVSSRSYELRDAAGNRRDNDSALTPLVSPLSGAICTLPNLEVLYALMWPELRTHSQTGRFIVKCMDINSIDTY